MDISGNDIHRRQQNETLGTVSIARGHANAKSKRSELVTNVTADKSRAADDANVIDFHIPHKVAGRHQNNAGI
jgi:hypothetical protein